VHVAFYDETLGQPWYATRPSSGLWTLEAVTTMGSTGQHSGIAVDDLGGVHVGYYDTTLEDAGLGAFPRNDFVWAFRERGGAVFTAQTIASDGDAGTYAAMAAAPGGYVYALYYDATRGDLVLVRRCP
jgi:hypothetical protein